MPTSWKSAARETILQENRHKFEAASATERKNLIQTIEVALREQPGVVFREGLS
jgi:hypothetical protein